MRGKPLSCVCLCSLGWITPAHAGKTRFGFPRTLSAPDHPRACGENEHEASTNPHCVGSPPRMRGKLSSSVFACSIARITPAHAGKTVCNRRRPKDKWDHPRACGENCFLEEGTGGYKGSPPRMRGKRVNTQKRLTEVRITPAHAGKTLKDWHTGKRAEDHPRACGENPRRVSQQHLDVGSPPRMRGKQSNMGTLSGVNRITPAHAGKTAYCGRKCTRR